MLQTDVLIIGGGAAGLRASIEARRRGSEVILASKAPMGYSSSTLYSGGGFRAAFGGYSKERHFEETIIGGKLLNDQELVRTLVLEGPDKLAELKDFGVAVKTREGGIGVSDGPLTPGKGLVVPMADYARDMGVNFLENIMAIDLMVNDSAYGTIFYDGRKGRVFPILSKAVVLATGGYSQLFARTDNPVRVSGDGCAMALRAGATLIDLELTQFFPIGLAEEGKPAWLFPALSGKLVNSLGEEILVKYGFNKPLSRAAVENRDMLSRAMWTEIFEGRGSNEALTIDLTHTAREDYLSNLSSIASFLSRSLDVKALKIKVAPTAHFTMGGIKIDVDCETNIPGLFACGEVSSGVHGANRLGGNALTEAIVFGARAGSRAAEWAEMAKHISLDESYIDRAERLVSSLKKGRHPIEEMRGKLKRETWAKCGVIRDKGKLTDLLGFIAENRHVVEETRATSNSDVMKGFELRNMFELAEAVALSALTREESRGAHYRLDFPEQRDDLWLKRIATTKIDDKLSLNLLPVDLKYFSTT